MSIITVIGITLLFSILLIAGVIAIAKGIKSGKIGAGAAKFFAFLGVLVVLGLFVLLMGVLKNLQG